jgi:hypothetical protein
MLRSGSAQKNISLRAQKEAHKRCTTSTIAKLYTIKTTEAELKVVLYIAQTRLLR